MNGGEYLPHEDEDEAYGDDGADDAQDDAHDVHDLRALLRVLGVDPKLAGLVVVAGKENSFRIVETIGNRERATFLNFQGFLFFCSETVPCIGISSYLHSSSSMKVHSLSSFTR